MRRLNDRLLSFLGPFKFCFITALDAIFNSKIYQILVRARKFEWCHYIQEIFLLSLRLWWKVPVRCGSQLTRNRNRTLKPLSSSVFEALKTVEILRRFRGQRGGQLRSSSRFSTSSFSWKFKVLANVVDLHKTSSVSSNIQNHIYDDIMETIPNAVLSYPSAKLQNTRPLFCISLLLPHRAAPSTFESTTINVASTPRGQPSSSSAQRNCTTSKLKIVHFNIRSLRSPSHLIELRDWAAANKRGFQWGGGFYGYRLKFWLFYGYRLIFFSYG